MDKKTALMVLTVGLTLAVWAEKQPLERYQSIIDRQMFGPLPPDFDPEKLPSEVSRSGSAAAEKQLTKEQEVLQSAIRFSVINVERDGKTAVGFTDSSDPKAPVHYYLRVGESQNGWTVKEADPVRAMMTLVRESDGVEVELKLGDSSGKGAGKPGAAGGAAVGSASGERRPGLLGGSLRARRAAREQARQEAAQKSAAEAAEKEAAAKAAREAEKAEREAEREQQRQQLMAIQEELRKAREEKERQSQKSESEDGANDTE